MGLAKERSPGEASGLIGREPELARIDALMARSRLVTLVGPGGGGKTRLASEWCARAGARPATVWVDLAPVTDGRQVVDAVLVALGARQDLAVDPVELLLARIADDPWLLVLDNCEQVIEGVADVVQRALTTTPRLSVLATSREALAVAGESVLRVHPLAVAPPSATVDEVLASDAVRLFLDRADRADVGAAIGGAEDLALVADICRRLDGLPLAIELAAARLGVLGPSGVADGLRDRFRLLTSGHRTVQDRQRTLHGCIDWSYRLLDPDEQRALRSLSVFRGGWTLEAAAAVVIPQRDDVDAAQRGSGASTLVAIDLLDRLRAKSLVVANRSPAGVRFRMLESVALFAADRLAEESGADVIVDRFLEYVTTLVTSAGDGLTGLQRGRWMEILQHDRDNVSAALELSAERAGASEVAAARLWRLVGGLTFFWSTTGRFREARDWFELALRYEGVPADVQVAARWGAAHVALYAGDFAFGVSAASQALAMAEAVGDAVHVARALNSFATATVFFDSAAGMALARRATAAAEQAGDEWCLADSLQMAGYVLAFGGDVDPAGALLDRARPIAERLDHPLLLAWDGVGRAYVAASSGRVPEARAILEGARHEVERSGDPNLRMNLLLAHSWTAYLGGGDAPSLVDRLEGGRRTCAREGAGEAEPLLATLEIEVLAGLGLADRAAELLDASFESLVRATPPARSRLAHARALTHLLRGESVRAETHSIDAVQSAPGRTARAAADVLGGLVALGRDDRGLAETSVVRALPVLHEAGLVPALIDGLEVLALVHLAKGDRIEAARYAGAAAAMREACGIVRTLLSVVTQAETADLAASPDAAERRAWTEGQTSSMELLIARAGRTRGARRRASFGWAAVTPTERRVAELAATGLSNSEIADALFVTAETVKTHLGHLYTKLGVRNRAALTAALLSSAPCPPDRRASRAAHRPPDSR